MKNPRFFISVCNDFALSGASMVLVCPVRMGRFMRRELMLILWDLSFALLSFGHKLENIALNNALFDWCNTMVNGMWFF